MAPENKQQHKKASEQFHHDHPYGTTLLSRDKPENRKQWGPSGIGYVDVAPTVCADDGKVCPHYHHTADATREGEGGGSATQTPIHLLIASYRDQLCPRTLHNAFSHAENPNRVYIRIIEQTEPGSDLIDDAGCWDRYCKDYSKEGCDKYKDNVRTVHVDATKAKGPTDARSKLSAMVWWDWVHKDEPTKLDFQRVDPQDFCMQTDSHMDFSDNYDTELILMHHRTQNDYAVLSTYVASLDQNNQDVRNPVPNLCMVTFTSTIRNWGTKECRHLKVPKLTNAMWGAGLSFHRCHAEINVPVDPYLDGVFDGEEGSRGLRFFTHGYDVYTPDVVLVTHDYQGHQHNPVVHTWGRHRNAQEMDQVWKFREDIERERAKVVTKGTKRVNMLLGIGRAQYSPAEKEEIERIRSSRFGIGTRRSLEQASKFSGIDLAGKKMVENKCGNLIWVPFEESAGGDYGVGETYARGLTGAVAESAVAKAAPHEVGPASDEKKNLPAAASIRGAAAKEAVRRDLRPVVDGEPKKKPDVSAGVAAAAAADARRIVGSAGAEQRGGVDAGSEMLGRESNHLSVTWIVVLVVAVSVLAFAAKPGRRRSKGRRHKH